VRLTPLNKAHTPNLIMKYYKSVEFLSNFRMSIPLNRRKAPIEN